MSPRELQRRVNISCAVHAVERILSPCPAPHPHPSQAARTQTWWYGMWRGRRGCTACVATAAKSQTLCLWRVAPAARLVPAGRAASSAPARTSWSRCGTWTRSTAARRWWRTGVARGRATGRGERGMQAPVGRAGFGGLHVGPCSLRALAAHQHVSASMLPLPFSSCAPLTLPATPASSLFVCLPTGARCGASTSTPVRPVWPLAAPTLSFASSPSTQKRDKVALLALQQWMQMAAAATPRASGRRRGSSRRWAAAAARTSSSPWAVCGGRWALRQGRMCGAWEGACSGIMLVPAKQKGGSALVSWAAHAAHPAPAATLECRRQTAPRRCGMQRCRARAAACC